MVVKKQIMSNQDAYKQYCEELYQSWLRGTANFADFERDFAIDYLPEPYLTFGQGQKKLYVLNYNPGGPMEIQTRANIRQTYQGQSYQQIAAALASYYYQNLKGAPKRRFVNMDVFAQRLGYDCVENLESFFLHSKGLKARPFLARYGNHDMVKKYTDLLTEYLKDKPVLSIAVVGAGESITLQRLQNDGWIKHICGIMSLDLNQAQVIPVTQKDGSRITSCIVANGNKYMSVFIGANQLAMPKDEKTWGSLKSK